LRARGLRLSIISGDHEAPTRRLAAQLGIDRYHAEVLPADKAAIIREIQREGRRVCFIGDGINDAIALKAANSSISLRGATTAATDTAQIILLHGDLQALSSLFALSDEYARNARNGDILSLGAGALCAGSVFLFHIGIFTAIVIYNLSFIASIGNAMLPRLRHQDENIALHKDGVRSM
jgi:Cu2+-exporting ATPase